MRLTSLLQKPIPIGRLQLQTGSGTVLAIQTEWAVADPDKATHRAPDALPHAPHLAVAPLFQHHLELPVRPRPVTRLDRFEATHLTTQSNTSQKTFELPLTGVASHPNPILALDPA